MDHESAIHELEQRCQGLIERWDQLERWADGLSRSQDLTLPEVLKST